MVQKKRNNYKKRHITYKGRGCKKQHAGYVKYTYMLSVNNTTMGYKTLAILKHHGL